ncbi:MAG: hypothetical protein ACRENL_04555 [Candidatus Dormibacteria bacterium]
MADLSAAALFVGTLGLVLSAASLTWQAATFTLSGARVRVAMRHGARNVGGIVSGLPGTQSLDLLANQGFTDEVVGASVSNVGRMAVQVSEVCAVLEGHVRISALSGTVGPALPHQLPPQSSESWFLPAQPVRAAVYASKALPGGKDPCYVWVEVQLGNGKVVKSKQRLLLGSVGGLST